MCCRLSHLRVAPKDQGLQGLARPLASCCEHTDVCRQINQIRAAPKGRHVPKVRSTRCCCKHTRACCGIIKLRISPKDQRLQRFGRPPAAVGTHMCVAAKSTQSCTEGRGLLCWQHTSARCRTDEFRVAPKGPVSCRTDQSRVAPTDQGYKGFGRPIAALSIHMCVAECVISGLHPRVQSYNGVADQLLLRAYTCVLQNTSIEDCTRGPRVTRLM